MDRVSVVGLGKIGLPLAVECARNGFRVAGCDIDARVVDAVNRGVNPGMVEAGLSARLRRSVSSGRLSATTAISEAVNSSAVVIVIVPLTLDEHLKPDFRHVDAAATQVGRGLQRGSLVIVETTVPVGVTRGRLGRILEKESGLVMGRDFCLAYSPERVYSGRVFRDLRRYPKVVGGLDRKSAAAVRHFYEKALRCCVLDVGSLESAEFVKLIETTYRDVNIALSNEFALYASRWGIDVVAAIAAANSQPFSHVHDPGVGVGGHCIPVYPRFLLGNGDRPKLPTLARSINDDMARYAVERVAEALGGLESRRVLVLGLAYRENVRETAFSSTFRLCDELRRAGASVTVHDPLFSTEEMQAFGVTGVELERGMQVDAVILQAYHREYEDLDLSMFAGCKVFLDGRNALDQARVRAAGMTYLGIGR